MDKIPTAPRVCKRQSSDLSVPQKATSVSSTEERIAKEVMGDGKAATLWRAAAVKGCWLHLNDLYAEALASHAAKRVSQ